MTGERRIASSHLLLMIPCLFLALGCVLVPVLGTWPQWSWLEPTEKAGLIGLDLFLLALSVLLFRIAFAAGIFVSDEGLRIQRMFRSQAIHWDEIGRVMPMESWRDGHWLLLEQDTGGAFVPEKGGVPVFAQVFLPSRGLLISSSYSAGGLRSLAEELLRRVPSKVWEADPKTRQWLMDHAAGSGSLISKPI